MTRAERLSVRLSVCLPITLTYCWFSKQLFMVITSWKDVLSVICLFACHNNQMGVPKNPSLKCETIWPILQSPFPEPLNIIAVMQQRVWFSIESTLLLLTAEPSSEFLLNTMGHHNNVNSGEASLHAGFILRHPGYRQSSSYFTADDGCWISVGQLILSWTVKKVEG